MSKPIIMTVDDEPHVLNAIARDLQAHYRSEFQIVKAGSGDEVHQLFIPGRDGSASDWAFDSLGIAVGLFMGNWLMGSKAAKWLR